MGKFYRILISIIIFICSISDSQDIVGKIYSNKEASAIYGPVLVSVSISSNQLNNLTFQTKYYLMFRILNGNLTILGDKRIVLYPVNSMISERDVFRYFSISLIQKIIIDGNNSMTEIELRNNGIITITNGLYTMEVSVLCPPYCN
jgi:hypothetical protein